MRPEGFARRLRLRRRSEFLRVQRSGQKHQMRFFLVFVAPQPDVGATDAREITPQTGDNPLPPTRLGVTVTRKVGGAIVRNRIKRWVREAFRRQRIRYPGGLDMVWVAKRAAAGSDYHGVMRDAHHLAERLTCEVDA